MTPKKIVEALGHTQKAACSAESSDLTKPEAAVAVIIRGLGEAPNHSPEVLLIQRATNPKDPWSGHMAFPGGRRDSSDATLLDTACRETHEEVGLDLTKNAQFLGCLPGLQAVARGRRTNLRITPHVFHLHSTAPLSLEPCEVQAYFWPPLAPLMAGTCDTKYLFKDASRTLKLPGFDVDGQTVWGLTHAMLMGLFTELRK